jgi:CO/xanthine dehydrogenase Mo-binding subunit
MVSPQFNPRRERAAFTNAAYNATGKRVRDLPITLDKTL